MHFRPPEEQNDHKVTCGVTTAALPRVVAGIESTLAAAGVQCNIITSGTGGRCLCVCVGSQAGGLAASSVVAWDWAAAWDQCQVITSGAGASAVNHGRLASLCSPARRQAALTHMLTNATNPRHTQATGAFLILCPSAPASLRLLIM